MCQAAENDDGTTAVTTTISSELESYGSQGIPSEQSTTSASQFMDDDSDGEDWSHFLDDDEDDSSSASDEAFEPGEGADATALHAMILLGRHTEAGTGY